MSENEDFIKYIEQRFNQTEQKINDIIKNLSKKS